MPATGQSCGPSVACAQSCPGLPAAPWAPRGVGEYKASRTMASSREAPPCTPLAENDLRSITNTGLAPNHATDSLPIAASLESKKKNLYDSKQTCFTFVFIIKKENKSVFEEVFKAVLLIPKNTGVFFRAIISKFAIGNHSRTSFNESLRVLKIIVSNYKLNGLEHG